MQHWGGGALYRTGNLAEDEKVKDVAVANKGQRKCALREQRMALEQDVAKLRKKLKQEVGIHTTLERAFRRTVGALPRLPPYLPPKTQALLAEVAVLEEEIIQLEEHVVGLRQGLYDEALYVSSSKKQMDKIVKAESSPLKKVTCFSPPVKAEELPYACYRGKRNSVVTKLLPPLKEEGDPSLRTTRPGGLQLKNSGGASLLPQKSSFRITQTPIQDSTTKASSTCHWGEGVPGTNATSKVSKSSWSTFSGMQDRRPELNENQKHTAPKLGKLCSEASREKLNMDLPYSVKTPCNERLQIQGCDEKAPSLAPSKRVASSTFSKDGDSTEPNRLSEEMLRCLLCIYLKLTRPGMLSDCDASSTVSRSTLSSFRSYGSRSSVSYKTYMDVSEEIDLPDPYGLFANSAPRDIGPYRYHHSIVADSFEYNRIPSSNGLLKRLRDLIDRLSVVDLRGLTHQQKLAFWINIYNVCMMHAFLDHGIPCSPHKVVALMRKAVLNVGGHRLNALAIEHFILRLPSDPHNSHLRYRKEDVNMRSPHGLEWPEPLVTFALSCGSQSSPAVRVYTASEVESELEVAKKEYLQAAVGVTTKKKVVIPKLLDWYMRDFAKDAESLIEWVCEELPSFLRTSVHECMEGGKGRALSQIVEVIPYDFNFRYLVAT